MSKKSNAAKKTSANEAKANEDQKTSDAMPVEVSRTIIHECDHAKVYTGHVEHEINVGVRYRSAVMCPIQGGELRRMDMSQRDDGIIKVRFSSPRTVLDTIVLYLV